MKRGTIVGMALIICLAILITAFISFNITGNVTQTSEIPIDFAVNAWGYQGWGDCSSQHGSWDQVDNYCKSKGYSGALPTREKPCYHISQNQRWEWDGKTPMLRGEPTAGGYAFTKVKCYKTELVKCEWTWPQTVNVAGKKYRCPQSEPYCYYPGVAVDETKCCRYQESTGYTNCFNIITGKTNDETPGQVEEDEEEQTPGEASSGEDTPDYEIPDSIDTDSDSGATPGAVDSVILCEDADGSTGYYIQTNTQRKINNQVDDAKLDSCNGNILEEFYCTSEVGQITSQTYNCQSEGKICKNGACIDPTFDYAPSCSGVPDNCPIHALSSCEDYPGCRVKQFFWFKWCGGTPSPCSDYSAFNQCESSGCDWEI